MIDKKDIIERRKQDRFKVGDGAFAAIKSDDYVVGPIQNISRGGMAFSYIGKEGQLHESLEVDIFFCGKGFYLQNVKSKTISDFNVDKKASINSLTIRQCRMQFYELTNTQISNIDNFILSYADKLSANDLNKFTSLQYRGPERRKK